MNKTARHLIPTMLALPVVLLTLAFVACGGNGETQEEVPTSVAAGEPSSATSSTADNSDGTPKADSSAATPVAELPAISGVSLDEYLMAVCGGQEELAAWEEDVSLRELSSGLEQHIGIIESLEPPAEVSGWHDAGLAFQRAFKRTVDDYLEDPGNQSEDEFLFSMFFTLASAFEPIEQAIAGMDPETRSRMAEAGCIDEETSESIPVEIQREDISVGGSLSGTLDEPDEIGYFQFQADRGQKYVIEVSWEGIPEIWLLIKDPPDPVVESIFRWDSESSPLSSRWAAPESGTFHIEVGAYEGTGSYNISISIDISPAMPSGVNATWEGSTVRVSWEPVEGADYYNVYHDDGGINVYCKVDSRGDASFCRELATEVASTSYVDTDPSRRENHYWVAACNSSGCSEIDSEDPASP